MANKSNKPSKILGSDLPAQPAETAQSVETTAKKKRAPIIRVSHPALLNGKKLSAVPADWSSIYHKALTKDDFESETVYLNAQADYYDRKAGELRQQAIDIGNGTAETSKAVKKVRSLITNLPAMLAEVAGKGVNIADLLNALKALEAKQTTPAAEVTQTEQAAETIPAA